MGVTTMQLVEWKKVIIREEFLYFLLVAEASESFDLALQVSFVVGVE